MGAPRTFPRIIDFLCKHAGKVVTIEQITDATGLTEAQVRSAISENRKRVAYWDENINVLSRGQSWSLRPSAVTTAAGVAKTNTVRDVVTPSLTLTSIPVQSDKFVHDADRDGQVEVIEKPKASKTAKGRRGGKPQIGDLLEVIGYAGQDILARAADDGQVYRVTEV